MTLRLAFHAFRHWREFDGWAASCGLADPLKMPISRFCNLVWFWMTDGVEDRAALSRLEAQLWIPPQGEVPAGPWSAEAEMASFTSLKASLGR